MSEQDAAVHQTTLQMIRDFRTALKGQLSQLPFLGWQVIEERDGGWVATDREPLSFRPSNPDLKVRPVPVGTVHDYLPLGGTTKLEDLLVWCLDSLKGDRDTELYDVYYSQLNNLVAEAMCGIYAPGMEPRSEQACEVESGLYDLLVGNEFIYRGDDTYATLERMSQAYYKWLTLMASVDHVIASAQLSGFLPFQPGVPITDVLGGRANHGITYSFLQVTAQQAVQVHQRYAKERQVYPDPALVS